MEDKLIFRMATSDDDVRILELFKSSFRRELPADWWRWLSYQCPSGLNRTYIIEDPDAQKLVGSYSLLPVKLVFNGRELNASICTNVNTHPDYCGQGLFTRLGRYALGQEQEFATSVSLGMPNQNAYPGHMKVGWQVMCNLPFLVKYNCRLQRHRCHKVAAFDQRFNNFFARIAKRFSFIVLKDHRFINWRVGLRPDKQYTNFVYEEEDDLKGYVILKHFDDKGYRKSHILDIHAEREDILHELIAAAESFAHGRDELNMWTNTHNPYHQNFLEQGFFEQESHDLLIVHFNYGEKKLIEEGNWWFCLADNDVY